MRNTKHWHIKAYVTCQTSTVHFYVFFWVIHLRLNFICRRFGTLCLFHLHRQVSVLYTYLPMKMEQTECSETSVYKIQTPRNYPEENIQHTEHGESLKSRSTVHTSSSSYVIADSLSQEKDWRFGTLRHFPIIVTEILHCLDTVDSNRSARLVTGCENFCIK